MSTTKTIAFFGATGGCTLAALTRTLQSQSPQYDVNALARTPQKLTDLLTQRGIPQATLESRLTIIQGDAKDASAVTKALTASTGRLVDTIVSGVGGTPAFRFHLFPFTLTDPNICADVTRTILDSVADLQKRQGSMERPHFIYISTTGISRRARDVPILFVPLYHWLLAVPHADKRIMESLMAEKQDVVEPTAVRPSFLLDGEAAGLEQVREGWENLPNIEGNAPGPAIGYTIARETVGKWIWERLLTDYAKGTWGGRMVSITT